MSNHLFTSIPPPSRTHTSRSISTLQAQHLISSYLSLSAEPQNPHLHPDCRFNERGPTLEGRPPGGGLILHQLDRVAKGLKGIQMVPQEEREGFQEGEAEVMTREGIEAQRPVDLDEDEALADGVREDADQVEFNGVEQDQVNGDYGEQMRAQGEVGIIQGEIGSRGNLVEEDDGTIPEIETAADRASKEQKREKKRKRDTEQLNDDAAPEEDARAAKRRRKEDKRRRKEEEERRRKHDEEAEELAIESDELPNGVQSQINGVSTQDYELHGDPRREEKLDRRARKEEKRARKEAQRTAKEEDATRATQDELASQSLQTNGDLWANGHVEDLESPSRTKHKANEKKRRKKRAES
ncbi:MAG: hypothetical protein Q9159_000832 [Coniocarpon cinnabarinum]